LRRRDVIEFVVLEVLVMGQIIQRFRDGAFLEYDRGSFDDWCVYLTEPSGSRKPPRDVDYFSQIQDLADKFGAQIVYEDYVTVYDMTGKSVDDSVFDTITNVSSKYGTNSLEVEKIFSILYMAMIAEEQKKYTRLGKRIKRLGIHKLLFEGADVREAANFMRGMGWRDIARLCEERGF